MPVLKVILKYASDKLLSSQSVIKVVVCNNLILIRIFNTNASQMHPRPGFSYPETITMVKWI